MAHTPPPSKTPKVAASPAGRVSSADNPGNELGRISAKLTRASASSLSDYMSGIAHDEALPLDERMEALRDIQAMAAGYIEEIRPKLPTKAPLLWRDRTDRNIDPYTFAYNVYGEALKSATKGALAKLDKSLANRLLEFEAEHGKPDADTYIPTKRDRTDELIATGKLTWREIMEAAPDNVRRLLRAYQSQSTRSARAAKKHL